jgi:hypothetical protein
MVRIKQTVFWDVAPRKQEGQGTESLGFLDERSAEQPPTQHPRRQPSSYSSP